MITKITAKPLFLLSSLLLASCGGASSSSVSSTPSSSSQAETTSTSEPSSRPQTGFTSDPSSQPQTGFTSEPESTPEESSSEELTPYTLDLKVATPAGAPSVAFYRHLHEPESKLEINADPQAVVAYLSANSDKDIVVAPTNAGLNAMLKKNAPFKIAATLTFGNFYLAGTGNDENKKLDNDDYVVAFQQNNVPDKIFRYVYPDLANVHYVNAASDAAACLISGKNTADDNATVDYVLMAEPALTNALTKNANAYQYTNIQEEFEKKSDGMSITQASIFVSNSADSEKVNRFLTSVREDVLTFLDDPSVIDSYVADLDQSLVQSKFSAPVAMLKRLTSANNRMGLGFVAAVDNQAAVENFASLFGISGITNEDYYQ